MRSLALPVAALLALVATVPAIAGASPGSAVTLAGPATADVPGTAMVTITIGLQLSEFHCFHDQAFHVGIALAATGVRAAMDSFVATFTVPEGSYAFQPWTGETNLTIQLQSTDAPTGEVNVTATFTSDGGANCLAPGGFPEANASLTIQTTTSAAPPPTPTPAPSTPPTAATPTPSTPPAPPSPTPTSATPDPGGANATSSNQSLDNLPPAPGGGYIGDYKSNANATPGVGVALAVAGAAGVAILMRRRP